MTPEEAKKLKKGDIVFFKNMFCHVLHNHNGEEVYIAPCGADVNPRDEWLVTLPSQLKLVTPVEDTENREEDA